MANDKISVIVPVYNLEDKVTRSVESLLNQTHKNLEIILVDDGSKDKSLEVINQLAFGKSNIKVIHQDNGGVTSARLTGVKAASGDWIGFTDGDDYVDPDMFERLLNNAIKYNADISHCGYRMDFPDRTNYYYNTGKLVIQDNETGIKDLLEGAFIEPGLINKLFRKSIIGSFATSNMIDLSIKNTEDLLMNYYLFSSSSVSVYEDFCPYHYMVRSNSAATSSLNKHKIEDPLKVLKIIEEDVGGNQTLNPVINQRIVYQLIQNATLPGSLFETYKKEAHKELTDRLGSIVKGPYSSRIKVMTLLAWGTPSLYRVVHKTYAHIRGTDKKYEVR